MRDKAEEDKDNGDDEEDHGIGPLVIQQQLCHYTIPRDDQSCRTWVVVME